MEKPNGWKGALLAAGALFASAGGAKAEETPQQTTQSAVAAFSATPGSLENPPIDLPGFPSSVVEEHPELPIGRPSSGPSRVDSIRNGLEDFGTVHVPGTPDGARVGYAEIAGEDAVGVRFKAGGENNS